jgi:hypothetical protein
MRGCRSPAQVRALPDDGAEALADGHRLPSAPAVASGPAGGSCALPPAGQLLFRGLRLRMAVAAGQLKGGLAPAGSTSGQVQYKGKAASQLARLMAKAKAGSICAGADLARMLPPDLASELTLVDKA